MDEEVGLVGVVDDVGWVCGGGLFLCLFGVGGFLVVCGFWWKIGGFSGLVVLGGLGFW